jgi:N-acetylmuramoyl-L-alanine amidase
VIDAGHGGYDFGMRTAEYNEKDITLKIAKMLQRSIEKSGRYVFLDREVDHYMSIEERRNKSNRHEPDVFLSLHLSGTRDINIYITWFEKKDAELSLSEYYNVVSRQRRHLFESSNLASIMATALQEGFASNVYIREMPLQLLMAIGSPAIIIEMPSEGMDYENDLDKMVSTIYKGIRLYEQNR